MSDTDTVFSTIESFKSTLPSVLANLNDAVTQVQRMMGRRDIFLVNVEVTCHDHLAICRLLILGFLARRVLIVTQSSIATTFLLLLDIESELVTSKRKRTAKSGQKGGQFSGGKVGGFQAEKTKKGLMNLGRL